MNCWHCGTELNLTHKISFRETCEKCHFYLHACLNCKNHQKGLSNECRVPGTEPVADRSNFNFCEDFEILGKQQVQQISDVKSVENRLFKDEKSSKELKKSPKDHFNSLFKDD